MLEGYMMALGDGAGYWKRDRPRHTSIMILHLIWLGKCLCQPLWDTAWGEGPLA